MQLSGGTQMKITHSHMEMEFRELVEKEFERHIEKLNRMLSKYTPDAIHLHSSLEKTPRRTEYNFSLNLTLPTGTFCTPQGLARTRAPGRRPRLRNSKGK